MVSHSMPPQHAPSMFRMRAGLDVLLCLEMGPESQTMTRRSSPQDVRLIARHSQAASRVSHPHHCLNGDLEPSALAYIVNTSHGTISYENTSDSPAPRAMARLVCYAPTLPCGTSRSVECIATPPLNSNTQHLACPGVIRMEFDPLSIECCQT